MSVARETAKRGQPCEARTDGAGFSPAPRNFRLGILLLLTSCGAQPEAESFPKADRPVAPIVADSFSTEDVRDRMGEATQVIELAGVKPGMWVADVGAGEGY